MWIPGTLSPETVQWCAEHRYPYIGLGTPLRPTCDLWDFYADEAAKHGYQAGPENFGYMVADRPRRNRGKGAKARAKASSMAAARMPFPNRNSRCLPAITPKRRSGYSPKPQTSAWLGISGEKMKEQMHGDDPARSITTRSAGSCMPHYCGVRRTCRSSPARRQPSSRRSRHIMSVLRNGIFIILASRVRLVTTIAAPACGCSRKT